MKSMGSGVKKDWAQIPAHFLTSCVILRKITSLVSTSSLEKQMTVPTVLGSCDD